MAIVSEVVANEVVIFYILLPSNDLSRVMEVLKGKGCGTSFGTIIVTTPDFMKPSMVKYFILSTLNKFILPIPR